MNMVDQQARSGLSMLAAKVAQLILSVTSTSLTAANFIDGEIPSGTVDGANAAFTLAHAPVTGSLHLYQNGVRQRLTTDYTLAGSTITYTAGAKPKSGDNHYADYRI